MDFLEKPFLRFPSVRKRSRRRQLLRLVHSRRSTGGFGIPAKLRRALADRDIRVVRPEAEPSEILDDFGFAKLELQDDDDGAESTTATLVVAEDPGEVGDLDHAVKTDVAS